MSSKQAEEMGLTRKGDQYEQVPEHFTILDVDISRKALLKRYAGKPTEIAIINGIKQERRQKKLGDPVFVESCEGGLTEPGQFIRLKPDNDGKVWLVIDKGNNRNFALRIVNEKRKLNGFPPFLFRAIQADRPGSGEATGSYVKERHHLSNVRAKTYPSQKAEAVASFRGDGLAYHSIIRFIDGVSTEAEVIELEALDACVESIKDAVDEGKVTVSAAARVSKWTEDRQEEWLKTKLAPKPEKVAPTVRPLSPKKVEKLHGALAKYPHLQGLLDLVSGKVDPSRVRDPVLSAACKEAFGETEA